MAKPPKHTFLRNGVYYFRMRIPEDLIAHFGKMEVRFSLKTSDSRKAKTLSDRHRVDLEREWEILRHRLARQKTPNSDLSDEEIWYLARRCFVAEFKQVKDRDWSDYSFEAADQDLHSLMNWEDIAPSAHKIACDLVQEIGLDPKSFIQNSTSSKGFIRLQKLVQDACVEAHVRKIRLTYPTVHLNLNPDFSETAIENSFGKNGSKTIEEVIDAYNSEPSRRKVTTKTQFKKASSQNLLIEYFGSHRRINSITRKEAKEYQKLFLHFPTNLRKHYPDQPLLEAVEAAIKKGIKPMVAKTANPYIRMFNVLMSYAEDEGWLLHPAIQLEPLPDQRGSAKNKKLPFTTDHMALIFNAPIYTGCKNDNRGFAISGPNKPRRARFWIPLVALFTGMRMNEICQLRINDIQKLDDTDVIIIQGDDDDETKRIKTDAGHRFVPIHSELKRLGFMQHVAQRKSACRGNEYLFPELTASVTGYLSQNYSDHFGRFLQHVGIIPKNRDPQSPLSKWTFHSFRHNFRDALREADLSKERVIALGGWAPKETEDIYGAGLRASTLAKDIEKIHYDGVNLSHLYVQEQ